jgi:hypothetical protein
MEAAFDALQAARAAAFPHVVVAHVSHRVRGGTYLSKMARRRGRDYRRRDASGERRFTPGLVSFVDLVDDTYFFRRAADAAAFRLWVPAEINQTAYARFKKERSTIDAAAYYCPYIPLTITGTLQPNANAAVIQSGFVTRYGALGTLNSRGSITRD